MKSAARMHFFLASSTWKWETISKMKASPSAQALPVWGSYLMSSVLLFCLDSEMLEAVTGKKSCVRHGEPVTTVPNSQEKPRLGSSLRRRHRALLLSAPEYQHKLDPRLTVLQRGHLFFVAFNTPIYLVRIKSGNCSFFFQCEDSKR